MNKTNTGHRCEQKGSILRWRSLIMLVAVLLAGCSPRVLPYEVTRTVVEYRDREVVRHDSVSVLDSVYVSADTVYINKYVYRFSERMKDTQDTVTKVDTIYVEIPVTEYVEVERKRSTFETVAMNAGIAAIALVVSAIILVLVRLVRKRHSGY